MRHTQKVPRRYIPKQLTRKDRKIQQRELKRSRRLYQQGKYYTRTKLASFPTKVSPHILAARKVYNITDVRPSALLAKKNGLFVKGFTAYCEERSRGIFFIGVAPKSNWPLLGVCSIGKCHYGGESFRRRLYYLKNGL